MIDGNGARQPEVYEFDSRLLKAECIQLAMQADETAGRASVILVAER